MSLSDDEIVAIIRTKTGSADLSLTTIENERENSLKFYNQELFGNEQEGRSQVVTSDVRDTIEWILPQVIEMFIGVDNPIQFIPRNAEDIEGAEQESKYVNYVYNSQNDGFLNTYTWFKDALLQKNGIVKAFWDEVIQETPEEYDNQSFGELDALLNDDELEIKEIIVNLDEDKKKTFKSVESFSSALVKGDINIQDPNITFGLEATRSENLSQVQINPVAPENFLILNPEHDSLDLSDAECREDMFITASDLIADGYDRKIVDDIPGDNQELLDSEAQERFRKEGGILLGDTGETKDTRKIKVSDIYIKLDDNDDGIAELRFIKLAGDSVILENQEVDSVPYFAITPNILTHKFYGMSIADMIADLQLLKSTLWRQSLDSLYLANNPRNLVVRGQVEIDDLLTSRPGGIVRADSPDAVVPLITPFVGREAIPMMDLIDKMREERTGVSAVNQGLDPNALSDSTNLVGSMIMNASMTRVKMIARIFAETGFKWLSLHIHSLIQKNEDNKKIADLGDGFVEVDPRSWRKRRDMAVKVGIGHAEKREKILSLERVLNMQKDIFAAQQGTGPLLNEANVYNAIQDLQKEVGLDTRDRYFSNPADFQPPPPQEDVQSEALDIAEADITRKAVTDSAQLNFDIKKHEDNTRLKQAELLLKAKNEEEKNKISILFKDADITEERRKEILGALQNVGQ